MQIGVDVGGTKIEVIALDHAGVELYRHRVSTPRDYAGTLTQIVGLVQDAERVTEQRGTVGIGIPGTLSPATGRVKNANSTWLIGHRPDRDLASRLDRPVTVMNDANCFALSEAVDGAGRGHSIVFGVILGTGVGGGIVIDGHIVEGAHRIAGEWGHNPLPHRDAGSRRQPACYCGRTGCVETYLSGPGLARDHQAMSGRSLSSMEIIHQSRAGDVQATATLDRYVERLGLALSVVVNIVDPSVIVLGGGMSNLPDLAARAELAMHPHVFTDRPATPVRRNVHGDSSGVRGAAWLGAAAAGPAVSP